MCCRPFVGVVDGTSADDVVDQPRIGTCRVMVVAGTFHAEGTKRRRSTEIGVEECQKIRSCSSGQDVTTREEMSEKKDETWFPSDERCAKRDE